MTYTPSTEGQLVSGDELAPDNSHSKGDGLRDMLRYQLEYYFSRENLASDTYLRSQMDSDQYVPIWTIANFNAVKRLTTDINLIIDVLRESPYLQVDDQAERVRPITKRCIVMLREIPDATPLEEVKALFSGENCPKFASCEFAHNCNWYVTFDSEADAQNAYKYLREEVKTFRGKPIMARIKAKPLQSFSAKMNGLRTPTTPTPPQTTATTPTSIYPQQQFQYSPVSPIMNGAQQPFAFYPNPNVIPQQWATSPPPFFDPPMAPFPGNGMAPQNKYHQHPMTVGRYGYQGNRNRNQTKTHQRTSSTPDERTLERNNNHEIPRSPHDRSSTANGTHNVSPRSSRDNGDRRDMERENGGYRVRRDNTSPKLGQQDSISHSGALPPRRGGFSRRGRRREDEGSRRRNSSDKREDQPKPPSPKLDLAPSSFPPLPGRENVVKTEETENKKPMMPMADILKGVKDPKRAVRPLENNTAIQQREGASSEALQKHSATPPSSPTTPKVNQTNPEEGMVKDAATTTTTAAVGKTNQQNSTANPTAQKQEEGQRSSMPKLSYAQMAAQTPSKKTPPPPAQQQQQQPPQQQQQQQQSQQKASAKQPQQQPQPQRQLSQRHGAAAQQQPPTKPDSSTEQSRQQNGENSKDQSANGRRSPVMK
ncbi:la-related protein 4-like isoform X2 [Ptychodera flava]